MFFLPQSKVEQLRQQFPKGTCVRCLGMNDPFRPVPAGTKGTVRCVDDAGQIHVSWDNGQGLALIYGEDRFEKVL
ncbi:MAG TPA: DUF4314 domain-containing protein [Succinivibrionaceae bacterium]|nr:DUF4314 domain-containing protein [Succinivibrionaceae bacterium]